jgi:hypothetical protein
MKPNTPKPEADDVFRRFAWNLAGTLVRPSRTGVQSHRTPESREARR